VALRRVGVLMVALLLAGGAAAEVLYQTDFEGMSLGTIDGQDSWTVGGGSGSSTDAMVVDDGGGNKVLQLVAGVDWGDLVRRAYDAPSTRRFLVVTMSFHTWDGGGYWFMDNWHPGGGVPPDALYWWSASASSSASPGIGAMPFSPDDWHTVGIQVDQDLGQITGFMLDGVWYGEDDSTGAAPPGRHEFLDFAGIGNEERLWVDDLAIVDSDTPAACFPLLWVEFPPAGDPQSWVHSCQVSVNGVVLPAPGCPDVAHVYWDWGDDMAGDNWFPATHTYYGEGTYDLTVTAYDQAGNATARSAQLTVDDCLLFANGDTDFGCCSEMTANRMAEDFELEANGIARWATFVLQDLAYSFPANWDGSLQWTVFADGGGEPGLVLASGDALNLIATDRGGGVYDVVFDLGRDVILDAGPRYWLGLHMAADWDSEDGLYWALTSPGFLSTAAVDIGCAGEWSDSAHHLAYTLLGQEVLFADGFETGDTARWQ
jgi:hypothetical protein